MKKGTQETLQHIQRVQELIAFFNNELTSRGIVHDKSKLYPPEEEAFNVAANKLDKIPYGTPEYKQALKDLGPALQHHYQKNSHHPEHYKNSISGMDLFDLVEMFLDWKAATERMKNGSLKNSIEHNSSRFNISSQLTQIFINTQMRYFSED